MLDRHLHADDDGLLADIEMAEAADRAHAVELARLLLEAADEQHLAIGVELLLAGELAGLVGWRLASRVVVDPEIGGAGGEAWAGHVSWLLRFFALRKG